MGNKNVVVEFCDLCYREGVPISNEKLSWDRQKINMDICTECREMVNYRIIEIPGMREYLHHNPPKTAAYKAAEGVNLTEVRDWAHSQGLGVSKRGRVNASVIQVFKEAHGILD
jgi:hypothetical protein